MHESGVIRDLVRRVEAGAREAGASRVSAVAVWIGALSQLSPEHLEEHFVEEARGTLAEGAVLRIETSADVSDPAAQQVIMRSIELEIPGEGA
jgi:hydrogenase nickel incorporation protein HypA/HybF